MEDDLQQFCVDEISDYNTDNSSDLSSDGENESFQQYNPSKKFNSSELVTL